MVVAEIWKSHFCPLQALLPFPWKLNFCAFSVLTACWSLTLRTNIATGGTGTIVCSRYYILAFCLNCLANFLFRKIAFDSMKGLSNLQRGLLLCVVFLVQVQRACSTPKQQKQALVDLYHETNGPSWHHSWDTATDPCADLWFGLNCTSNQDVTGLILPNNGLKGGIPESIGNLTELLFLYIDKNMLEGTLPKSIGSLTQLQQIGINDNNFTGTIPSSFASLKQLQRIYVQNNNFTGSLEPFANLPGLVYAYFSNNNFNETIPQDMGNLVQLQQLGVDSNRIVGTIPVGFGSKQNYLQSFYVQNNDISGSIPSALCNIPNCYAMGNNISCPVPSSGCCHVSC